MMLAPSAGGYYYIIVPVGNAPREFLRLVGHQALLAAPHFFSSGAYHE